MREPLLFVAVEVFRHRAKFQPSPTFSNVRVAFARREGH